MDGSAGPGRREGGRVDAGSGPSQVGVSGAMRARDVSRPDEEQLTEAEARAAERLPHRPRVTRARSGAGGAPRSPRSD